MGNAVIEMAITMRSRHKTSTDPVRKEHVLSSYLKLVHKKCSDDQNRRPIVLKFGTNIPFSNNLDMFVG